MDRIADALMMRSSLKQGPRMADRVASIANIAEPILGVDRSRGERAEIRILPKPKGWLFVTKSIWDTMLFPHDHPRACQKRYRWVMQPEGWECGYLVDGATPGGESHDDE